MKIYRDYKLEIVLEIFILLVLLVVIYFGNIHIGNIVDGTFVAAVLSVPVAIVSYISSKKNDKDKAKENLYYEKLDRIIQLLNVELSTPHIEKKDNISEKSRDEDIIKIQLLQLDNIYESGKKNINAVDEDRFSEVVREVALRLIFQGFKFENCNILDILKRDPKQKKTLISINQLLKNMENKKYLENYLKSTSTTHNDIFSWKEIIDSSKKPDSPINKFIFFNPLLKDFESDDLENYSDNVFINPYFEYTKKNERDTLQTIMDLKLQNTIVINPQFKFKDDFSTYDDIKNLYNSQDNDDEISVKYDILENLTDRNEIKQKYALDNKTVIRFSRTYYNESEKEYEFNSWFKIKEKNLKNFNHLKFAIVDDKKGTLLLSFTKKEFQKLLNKKSSNGETTAYNFYFKVPTIEYKKFIKDQSPLTILYDTRVPKYEKNIRMNLYPDNLESIKGEPEKKHY